MTESCGSFAVSMASSTSTYPFALPSLPCLYHTTATAKPTGARSSTNAADEPPVCSTSRVTQVTHAVAKQEASPMGVFARREAVPQMPTRRQKPPSPWSRFRVEEAFQKPAHKRAAPTCTVHTYVLCSPLTPQHTSSFYTHCHMFPPATAGSYTHGSDTTSLSSPRLFARTSHAMHGRQGHRTQCTPSALYTTLHTLPASLLGGLSNPKAR
jgi:hypothetical protein